MSEQPHVIQRIKQATARINERAAGLFAGLSAAYNYGYELTGQYHESDRKRMLWDQAGYPDVVEPDMLFNMYRRMGIANAVVDLIANKTWQTPPTVYDGEIDPERRKESPTEFEQQFDKYAKKWQIWHRLLGADKRQRVMRYSGLMIVCREPSQRRPHEPLTRIIGPEAIIKFQPVYESQIVINEAYTDITDPRYGLPKYYQFRARTPGSRNAWENEQYELHPSRVIPFAEGADDGSPYGTSTLEPIFNALLDIEKTRMAAAEGHYKKAKQRTVINLGDDAGSQPTDEEEKAIDEAVDKFEREMNNMLLLQNAEAKTLDTTLYDPEKPWQIALNEVAAAEEVPATILIGQMTGRLASDEDQSAFGQRIMSRRRNFAATMICDFIDRMADIGALMQPIDEINIDWDDLTDSKQSEKFGNAKTMAETNKTNYDSGGSGEVYTEDEMREAAGMEPRPDQELDDERLPDDIADAPPTETPQAA